MSIALEKLQVIWKTEIGTAGLHAEYQNIITAGR